MINQLLADYQNKLCTEELIMIQGFYEITKDFNATMILSEKLALKGYGIALQKASPESRAYIDEYIQFYKISQMTGTSIEYLQKLPIDIQDELIENSFDKKKLFSILNLENIPLKTIEYAKPSLLKKLRYYQEWIKTQN